MLQLVVHTCRRALNTPFLATNTTEAEPKDTNVLEQNISRAVRDYGQLSVQSTRLMNRNAMVSDLHRLASLIYVDRAIHHVPDTNFRHRRLVREGIMLLTNMRTCQNAWPLFIIACEAINDDQRLAILDVFERSRKEQRRRSSHIHLIQHMVKAVWKQHDLDTENRIDHLTIIDAVIGAVPFMPVFA